MLVGVQQYVVQLYVTVNHALRMDVVERVAQIAEPDEHVVLAYARPVHVIKCIRDAVLVEDKIHHVVGDARRTVR